MPRPAWVVLTLGLLAAPLEAQVGLASSAASVSLTATKHGSVSVSLPAGSSATLPLGLVTGPNDFAPVPVETAWDLDPSATASVTLVAFFDAPAAALAGGGVTIPAAAVHGRVATGAPTSFLPFNGAGVSAGGTTAGMAGASLILFTQAVAGHAPAGRRTDDLQVRLDLTGLPDLPAGTYRGTLNLLAITQ